MDISSGASLDGATIRTEWHDGELWITWRRFGQTVAGLVLSEEHAIRLGAAIIDAMEDKREEEPCRQQ